MNKQKQDKIPFYKPQGNEVELFEHAYNNQLPLLIKGPTGCGKTRFIRHMAAKLDRPLYTVACHDDLTAADLVGRHLINDKGTYWCDGPLTKAVREGAICYLDEVVEARKDTTVVLHPLTDDRRILPIERTGETLSAPEEFMLVTSYNPGYQNLLKGMKPSTRQRFVAMSFDFPDVQTEIFVLLAETDLDKATAEKLVGLATSMRALKDHDLEEAASTRLLIYTATLIASGMPILDACRAALVEPLTDDQETIDALMEVVNATLG
ncbi:ATPase AAA [Candidatus Thioglobus autotrophicus]|uniref:ATPase AAA n=1 Tax=Candidatus Thioglobus autotrophicus TaxID=1705394 RepID=A0A0M4NX26_9GAMM|nr:CbbQ/NirQ/NorQ/GpvN family protein [Candidatus Thioglobus autotrophicus]ALE52489.1 ATPase AAA [Candidatus Thioglobus autotrophicus]WPE16513.1 CbbQ/NirQ/NorQ/GpvN family protein [Candidatus Thioglobus autotrophicus]WPE18060.1 CbbQ/NirQ/NorQ/GpvN family protein [Candidatus Thioglobus autotrophicus]